MATDGLPGWVCVGHSDPQAELRVCVESSAGTMDVTRSHAIVALKPLTVAVGAQDADLQILSSAGARLVLHQTVSGGEVLGYVKLRFSQSFPLDSGRICLLQTQGGRNTCVPVLRRQANYLYERWKMSRHKDANALPMIPSELFSMWILHDVPRPVYLVSYGETTRGNMFPMDLLGPLSKETFVLGMHSTSPAIPIWRESPQIAVSSVPLRYKPFVYAMGKNHRQPFLEPFTLPVPHTTSKGFRIPIPAEALSVRELTVERLLELGSHVLIVARTRSFEVFGDEPRMCHVHRFYQQFLMRNNRPLPSM